MDKVIVTQADREAAARWGTGPVYNMQHLAEAFARHRIQHGAQGEAVVWQRRQQYSDIPGYIPQWQIVSKDEATNHFERRAGYEYRPLYTAPPTTADQLAEAQREIERLREALTYVLRAYEYEAQGVEDTLLMVPEGSRVFSIASARAALEAKP